MTDLSELKRLAEVARSSNRSEGYMRLANACTAATILSLIERVERAEGDLEACKNIRDKMNSQNWDNTYAMIAQTARVEEADQRGYLRGLEEAAKERAKGLEQGLEIAASTLDEARIAMAGETVEIDVTAEEVFEFLRKTAKTFRTMKAHSINLAKGE